MKKQTDIQKTQFNEILSLIISARENAFKAVNKELISLYWNIGEYLSKKIKSDGWGNSTINNLVEYIQNHNPEIKGFTRRNLYRMKQFYEVYNEDEFVPTVLSQIPWSSHLHIISKTKSKEERLFYINLANNEKLSVRELERQIDSCYFERTLLSKEKVPTVLSQFKKDQYIFKDLYLFEFLNLPKVYTEKDFQSGLLSNLKKFILEIGKDFIFIDQEYRLQVGGNDYFIDLLFYHRELRCLVALELKIDDFKPEYIGKMNFYLEALDRDVKKTDENPSVGIIICKSKNQEIVEYSMNRNLSPTMIAEYETKLISKTLLQSKINEIVELNSQNNENNF